MRSEKVSVKDLAILGMLSGVIILLGYTPIGLITLGPISATTIHIPVIIGAIVLGGKKGTVLSAVMGVVSFLRALTAAGWLDQLFRNPLVSILPRIFIGVAAYYMYIWFKKLYKKEMGAYIAGSLVGAITNTVLTLGALVIAVSFVFPDKLQEVITLIVTVVSINAAAEAVITAIIVPPVVYALRKLKY